MKTPTLYPMILAAAMATQMAVAGEFYIAAQGNDNNVTYEGGWQNNRPSANKNQSVLVFNGAWLIESLLERHRAGCPGHVARASCPPP